MPHPLTSVVIVGLGLGHIGLPTAAILDTRGSGA